MQQGGEDPGQPGVPGAAEDVQPGGDVGGTVGGAGAGDGDAHGGGERAGVRGRAGTHRPQRGGGAQPVLDDGGVHPVGAGGHMACAYPLGDAAAELLVPEAVDGADDVALLT